jgi:hypothetical protein
VEALAVLAEQVPQAETGVTVEMQACSPYLVKVDTLGMVAKAARVAKVAQAVLALHQVEMVVRAELAGVAAVWEERKAKKERVAYLAQVELVERMVLLV